MDKEQMQGIKRLEVSKVKEYILDCCVTMMKCDRDSFYKILQKEENHDFIEQFCSDQQKRHLIVGYVKKEGNWEVQIQIEMNKDQLAGQSVIFIKRNNETQLEAKKEEKSEDSSEEIHNQIQTFNLSYSDSEGPFEVSQNYIQHCLIPTFNIYKEIIETNESNDVDSYNQLLKKLREVNLVLIQFQQSVYVPQIQLVFDSQIKQKFQDNEKLGIKTNIEDFNLDDNEFINSLCKSVSKWTNDIQQVIKQNFDLQNGTTLQEINYWMKYERALNIIDQQLKQPEVEITLDILKVKRKVQITASFNDLNFNSVLQKAKECNKFIKELPINDILSANSMDQIHQSVANVFSHLMNLNNLDSYSGQRSAYLLEAVCRDLIEQLLKILRSQDIMNIKFQEFDKNIHEKFNVIYYKWNNDFMVCRDMIRKQKGSNQMMINYLNVLNDRLDLLFRVRRPHEKLKEIIQSTIQKNINNNEQNNHFMNIKEMDEAYQIFLKADVLDLSQTGLSNLMHGIQNYNEKIGRIETQITMKLREMLSVSSNANDMLRILKKFNSLNTRERFRGVIHEYQTQLLQNVTNYVQTLKDKFVKTFEETDNFRISSSRDIPPTSAQVIWMTQIQRRLLKYKERVIDALGTNWLNIQEAKQLNDMIEKFNNHLNPTPICNQWTADMAQKIREMNLQKKLFEIIQRRELEVRVNFEDWITSLFKEVRHFRFLKGQRIKLSYSLTNTGKEVKQIYPYAVSLRESLHSFNQICSKLDPKVSKLVAQQRLDVLNNIQTGFGFTWHTKHLAIYTKKLNEKVLNLEEAVLLLREKTEIVQQQLTSLMTCPPIRDQFIEKINIIQQVIDEFNFKDYANLHLWVPEIDSKIEETLAKRLQQMIEEWYQEFLDYSFNQYERNQENVENYLIQQNTHHELKIQNQMIFLDPPLEFGKFYWYQNLHKLIGIVCTLPRLESSRFKRQQQTHHSSSQQQKMQYSNGVIGKLPKGFIKGIYEKLNSTFKMAEEYVEQWLSYQALWSLENRQVFDQLEDNIELWQQLLNELKQDRQTFDNNETEKYFGAILIDYRLVQAKINNKYDNWHKEIIHTFANTYQEQIRSFYSSIQMNRQKLEKMNFQTATGNDIVNIITDLQEIKKKYNQQCNLIDKYKNGQKLLDRQRFVPPNDWLYTDMVEGEWNVFRQIFQRKCGQMEQEYSNLQQRVLQEEQQVNEKVNEIETIWRQQKPYSGELQPSEALDILEVIDTKLEKVQDSYNKICKAKELLGLESGDTQKLNILQEDSQGLKQVWEELNKVWSKIDVLKETPINAIVPKKLQQQLNQANEMMEELPSKFNTYQCYEQMKQKIQNIKKTNILVMDMKNDSMKERHWKQILSKLKINNVVFNELTLGQLWSSEPQKYRKQIEEILNIARGEMVLEDMIRKVKDNWNSFELELVRYQSKCKLIKGWDEMFSQLDEDIANLQSMKMSPYYKQFEEEIKPWDEKLQKIRIVMDIWMDVQRKWVYLESIFNGSSDIKQQLNNEYNRFKGVDSEFIQLMKKVASKPNIIDVIQIPEIQKTLERLSDLFEKIKKALGEYLETQRQAFSRFYFVGDDDLLEIIGNSKDLMSIQRHFTKMYSGIQSLMSTDNDSIQGISSREGESVKYIKSIKVSDDPTIKVWLKKVDDQMQNTLSIILEETIRKIGQSQQSKIVDILQDQPCQTSLLALQVVWCQNVEEVLINQNNDIYNGLQKVITNEIQFLDQLAVKVLDPLERKFRQKLEQTITEKVHQRDVMRQMIVDQIQSVKDFSWSMYLKFYWKDKESDQTKKLQASVDKAQFNYGFEYLGIGDRLVQTLLNDKCFLTLSYALHMKMGGAPFGPAGTGKTESVKALGSQLGYFVLVFNCDETFDFNAMGRIFVGLCQVGAWGCFDEFNRLEERMLSAVSQQILTIQMGLKEGQTNIDLLSRDVKLNYQMGIFVTMNPDYAGRSNLPENLKQLFRQMAMIKPDRDLIAQVKLYSQGYKTAERLSGKIVSLFELCADQLSNQPHYDFGLRALKSVLTSAGNMKREEQQAMLDQNKEIEDIQLFEERILIKSVCETFVPKLIQDDIPLLANLLLGVFPNSEIPQIQQRELEEAIKAICGKRNLLFEPQFIDKCLQLFTIQRLQHGVMLVGPSGCGKSQAWKVLAEAMERVDKVKTEWYIIDPKAISKDELYGRLDNTTMEWTDGVFTGVLRKITENQRGESQKKHWIVFDGDVDPEWAENLNSVLDDNKLLTLPNGERISIPGNVRLLFEVETLKYATLATVSRCGMVWFSQEVVSLQMIFNHYLMRLKQDDYDSINTQYQIEGEENKKEETQNVEQQYRTMCVEAIRPIFLGYNAFAESAVNLSMEFGNKHVMDYTNIRVIEAMFALIRKSISNVLEYNDNHNDLMMEQEQVTKYMRKQTVLAIMWGFSGSLKLYERANYSKKLQIMIENSNIQYLELTNEMNSHQYCLIDYECNIENGEWNLWKNKVPTIDIDPQRVDDADLIISTVDTLRHQDVLCSWLSEHRPFLLCGPPGSGKTMTLMSTLKALPDFEMIFINFSSSTQPSLIIQQFEHYGEYVKTSNGIILRPKQPNKWLVVFCDEINLPDADIYGTMAVITFLRQLTEQNGFWRSSDKTFVTLERIQFVGACNPPTDIGRNVLSNRFLRHCPLILVDFPGRDSLIQIYGTFNRAMLKKNPSIRQYADQLTEAMVEFYTQSQQHFTADQQPHYIYSPRELTRWKHAINEALEPLESVDDLIRLWAHEALRLFSDRLVYDYEKKWCDDLIDSVSQQCFGNFGTATLDRPILFTTYISKNYESVEKEQLREFIQARLKQFNEEVLNVQLVIFDSVLEHILRIDRVLRQPLGHLLLVGASGVGKTTLTRFVSWMNNLNVFQIKAGRNYSLMDFDTDLRDVMKRAGVKNEKITFIFDESNVLSVAFLERMNALLASGEVPGLFEGDDYNVLINQCKDNAINQKQVVDTEDQLYRNFIKNVQRNLHVVFTMNPANPDFSNRSASSPALFNRCVIDWFGDWSQEALIQVAKVYTQNIDPDQQCFTKASIKNDVEQRQNMIVMSIVSIHNSLQNLNTRLQKAAKKYNYITPRDYLDFIKHFIELYNFKISELEEQQMHLSQGLNKLNETSQEVIRMQASLDNYQKELDIKDKEAKQKLNQITDQKGKAKVSQDESIKLKDELKIKSEKAKEKQYIVQTELDQALPALEAAKNSVSSITNSQLTEIKNLPNPPELVKFTLNAVLCLTLKYGKEYDWKKETRSEISKTGFINSVLAFDVDALPQQAKDYVNKTFMAKENWEETKKAIYRSSKAAGPLAEWVYSQLKYSILLKKVDPLRNEVKTLVDEQQALINKDQELAEYLIELEKSIESYEEEYKILITSLQNIQMEMKQVQEKVVRSQNLINNLQGEKVRWESSQQQFQQQIAATPGDSLLAAAFLAYLGFFDHFYRSVLLKHWHEVMNKHYISFREEMSIIQYLSKPSDRFTWQSHKLPSDELCTQNAIILSRFHKYPLIIDPSGQALEFILSFYQHKKISRTSFSDDSFMKNLETALRFGCPLLVQDVEKIDPILNSVLNKELYKQGGRVLIRVGDQEIDFADSFLMFMITRDSSARFTPDLCSRVTFVNFTITPASLQNQCLNIYLKHERPDIEEKRIGLLKLQGEYQVKLRELEDNLLNALSNVQGNILDDEKVIATLEKLKKEAGEVQVQMDQSEVIMEEVLNVRNQYIPLSQAASKIYFSLQTLNNLHYLYQFSLQFFMDTVWSVLDNNETLKQISKQEFKLRQDNIYKELFIRIYNRTNLCLLGQDKSIFALRLVQIYLGQQYSPYFDIFIKPSTIMDTNIDQSILEKKLSIIQLKLLQSISDNEERYQNLTSHIISNQQEWLRFMNHDTPEDNIPKGWENTHYESELQSTPALDKSILDILRDMTVLRILRPDRIQRKINQLIQKVLNLNDDVLEISDVVDRESNSKIPILLCSAPGFDPSFKIESLSKQRNIKLQAVAIGSGESLEQGEKLIDQCSKNGQWVLLKNVHLAPQWLQEIEKKIHRLVNPNPSFRLFLTMEFNPKVPLTLIRQTFKLVFEPPEGIKASLQRSYKQVINMSKSDKQPVERARIYFILTWIHAVILERLRFTPLGWTKKYEFNEADQRCALETIDEVINLMGDRQNIPLDKIPWDNIRNILIISLYGGKIDNEFDVKVLSAIINYFCSNKIFDTNYPLFISNDSQSALKVPDCNKTSQYIQWIDNLPDKQTPQWAGLPLAVEKVLRQNNALRIISKLWELQDSADEEINISENKDNSTGQQQQVKWLTELGDRILVYLNILPDKVVKLERNSESMKDPLFRFLERESTVASNLLDMIRKHLKDVHLMCKGEINATNLLKQLANDLHNEQIPKQWKQYQFQQDLQTNEWLYDFKKRISQFQQLAGVQNYHQKGVWFGGLLFPEAYLTATRQFVSQINSWSLEELVIKIEIPKSAVANSNSFIVKGMYIEGATWDVNTQQLGISNEISQALPDVLLTWERVKQEDRSLKKDEILVPVYLNRFRRNLIFSVKMKLHNLNSNVLYQRGIALILWNI